MNIDEKKKVVIEKADLECALLENLRPISESISHVSRRDVFFNDMSYEENNIMLSKLSRLYGKYTLKKYYMNGYRLSATYHFVDFDANFFYTDSEHALEKLSGGKCSIETKNDTTQYVVCGIS